jgi:hypothetical protein
MNITMQVNAIIKGFLTAGYLLEIHMRSKQLINAVAIFIGVFHQ